MTCLQKFWDLDSPFWPHPTYSSLSLLYGSHRCSEVNVNAIRTWNVLRILLPLGPASEEKLFHWYLVKNNMTWWISPFFLTLAMNTIATVYNRCVVGLRIPTDMWLLLYFPSLSLGQLPHWCTGATLLHSSHPWPWKHRFYCLWRFQKPEGGSDPCVSWPQLSRSVLCWVLLVSHQDHLSEMHMGSKKHELAPRVWKDLWLLENFPRG